MNVAVGRLQLSITMASPAQQTRQISPGGDSRQIDSSLEHAYQIERRHQEVEADRRRWITDQTLRNIAR
jgi:hypothetical protein